MATELLYDTGKQKIPSNSIGRVVMHMPKLYLIRVIVMITSLFKQLTSAGSILTSRLDWYLMAYYPFCSVWKAKIDFLSSLTHWSSQTATVWEMMYEHDLFQRSRNSLLQCPPQENVPLWNSFLVILPVGIQLQHCILLERKQIHWKIV